MAVRSQNNTKAAAAGRAKISLFNSHSSVEVSRYNADAEVNPDEDPLRAVAPAGLSAGLFLLHAVRCSGAATLRIARTGEIFRCLF